MNDLERRFLNRFRKADREEVVSFLKERFNPKWLRDGYAEYRFIAKHFDQHGVIPTDKTIQYEFPDFQFGKTRELLPSLRQALEDREAQNTISLYVDKAQNAIDEHDMEEAKSVFAELSSRLITEFSTTESVDWAATGRDRADSYVDGWSPGVRVGWPTLDSATGGFQPGQFIAVVARPNTGKSFVVCHWAHQAWKAGRASVPP